MIGGNWQTDGRASGHEGFDTLGGETVEPKTVRRKRRKLKEKVWQKVKRVRRKSGGLKESLVKVLTQAGKPLHVDDILKGLKAVGPKTTSKNIKKPVGVRLYTGKEFFKTAPGTFALKAIGVKGSKTIVKKSSVTGKRPK